MWGAKPDEHQGALQQLLDAPLVDQEARYAVLGKAAHRIGWKPHALQGVQRDQWLVDVQLELSLAGGKANRRIKAHDLGPHHGECLHWSWVRLARHD